MRVVGAPAQQVQTVELPALAAAKNAPDSMTTISASMPRFSLQLGLDVLGHAPGSGR